MRPETAHDPWLWSVLADTFRPPSLAPAWQWMEENITLGHESAMPGRYETALTPFVRLLTAAAQNPRVRRVTVMVSAQAWKSQWMLNLFAWVLENDPGTAMWVMANAEMCEDFIETRLKRALERTTLWAKMRLSRSENRKDLVQFPSMDLLVRGSTSRAKLQSTPVRWGFFDERADWKEGAIEDVRNRFGTFHNAKEISAGTAGNEDDRYHLDWKSGSQTVCAFRCLACNHSQPWRMGREPTTIYEFPRAKGGLRWEQSQRTKPGTEGWEQAVMETIRWECESCGHLHAPADKPAMIATIHGIDLNPCAPEQDRSFQSPAFPMLWPSGDWGRCAVRFLKACQARDHGDLEPLKDFVQKVLAEPWRDTYARPENAGDFDLIKLPYTFNEPWPEEVQRFIAVDCQAKGGEHYWWLIRSISATGARRLVAYGRALTLEQVEDIRRAYNVPKTNALIDHGFKGATIARWCAASGWKPMKGEDDATFTVKGPSGPVRRFWAVSKIDPQIGTGNQGRREIELFRWSNPSLKDLYQNCLDGRTPGFSIPETPGKDWLDHNTAEIPVDERNSRGELLRRWKKVRDDDHLRDCELMILAGMTIAAHYKACPPPGFRPAE